MLLYMQKRKDDGNFVSNTALLFCYELLKNDVTYVRMLQNLWVGIHKNSYTNL